MALFVLPPPCQGVLLGPHTFSQELATRLSTPSRYHGNAEMKQTATDELRMISASLLTCLCLGSTNYGRSLDQDPSFCIQCLVNLGQSQPTV